MNSEVREILLPLCKGKRPDDYVWLSPKTDRPLDEIKKAFISACEDAGIEGLFKVSQLANQLNYPELFGVEVVNLKGRIR